MFWYTKYQFLLLAVLITFQGGNGERIRRMAYEVLQDELDFAETMIRQQRTGDWSSRLSMGADSSPSSTTYVSEAPNTSATAGTTYNTQTPKTHIKSIIKAIRVLEDIDDKKSTSAPSKKRYFKGAYKSLSTSRKVYTLPTALPMTQEKMTVKISPVNEQTTKSFPTTINVKKSTKAASNFKRDHDVMQIPTANPTTPLPKLPTSSSKTSEALLRRAQLKEYTSTYSTPQSVKETQKVPTAYLIPVDTKLTSPADVISKSVTKSIQKIPKWQNSGKVGKKASTSKLSKHPIAKKVVVVKKVIKPTRKVTTSSPTAGYKYPELYNYRQQDDESEEDYLNEYRKRLEKEYQIPRYDDSDEHHYRLTTPIKRMKGSTFSSNEEPEEPPVEYPPFEMPKIDLSATNLNQKGCKTVVKEVQEHPVNDKTASATILHPIFESFPSISRKKRNVKSIIVTKECVFPGDDDGSKEAPYQTQADNLREIYHPFSSKRPDILKPQQSRISTHKKEYVKEPKSERYSKSYSRSYHSTSKPYRKEHSYYSTSKPIIKQYSHSESSGDNNGRNRNYNPYEPKNFGGEASGFRPNYHHEYQGPHFEESRGVTDHRGSFRIPDYGRLIRENYRQEPDYTRSTNHDRVYRPAYDSSRGRDDSDKERKESRDNRGDEKENKPKKSRKSFAYYRKDNDPKNNGFSEQYAKGSFASYSTDYDSDRDGPERNIKRQ